MTQQWVNVTWIITTANCGAKTILEEISASVKICELKPDYCANLLPPRETSGKETNMENNNEKYWMS